MAGSSRSPLAPHLVAVGISTDEIVVSAPLRQTSGPAGARWVEAARTELGQLATLGGLFDNGFNEKKRKGSTTATAETAFLLAIDASEKDTDRKDSTPPRHEMPKLIRPAQPIFGDTEPMTPPCPAPAPIQQVARPRLSIAPEAVRAILAQPTAMLAPSDDPEALQRITIGPVGQHQRVPAQPTLAQQRIHELPLEFNGRVRVHEGGRQCQTRRVLAEPQPALCQV